VADLAARFEAKVDRTGEHHVWTGSTTRDGIGKLKVNGATVTARRVAWEFAHGRLPPDTDVKACPANRGCVRVEHLSILWKRSTSTTPRPRAGRGGGSKRQVRPGVWKLTATIGTAGGVQRRATRIVHAETETAANRELAGFVAEVVAERSVPPPDGMRDLRVDDAVELFLTQHLREEKGREERTISDYRNVHHRWFAPTIGQRLLRTIEPRDMDQLFGRMRSAGLSRSQMNQAKSLYAPLFRWAKARRIIVGSPMRDFELPTSRYVSRERTPPEAEELSLLLNAAAQNVPEIAPLLVLGAVTGMRRGELVGLRRSRIKWDDSRVVVDAAVDEGRRVKGTKTRRERSLFLDTETMDMLRRHCQQIDQRAGDYGITIDPHAFLFSLTTDCSTPMPPDYVTKRVAVLKDHLGIAAKRPETVALEDGALRLFRQPRPRERRTITGPLPTGGMSYREIAEQLQRSERWVALAIASATRRETASARGDALDFDGSILALRRFTSSELLDSGFNISLVAQRQGHGPGVLVNNYSKGRKSADRNAAEHLGRVVHGRPATR
jgi:integrase